MRRVRACAVIQSTLVLVALLASLQAIAHPGHEPHPSDGVVLAQSAPPVSAAAESDTVTIGGLTGPRGTGGISSIREMGVIDLGEEFPAMRGRQMRARIFTIEPGGVIGVHAHEQRPGYALIISGSIVEHRNDAPAPLLRKPGDIAIEQGGVAHWWENVSTEPVKALVVDIVGAE